MAYKPKEAPGSDEAWQHDMDKGLLLLPMDKGLLLLPTLMGSERVSWYVRSC